MPDKDELRRVIGRTPSDLKSIRMPGLEKPFEELTISELVQLRPGSEVADTYEVNAFTDNVSATTSSVLAELGNIQRTRAIDKVVDQQRLDSLRARLGGGRAGGFGPLSAEPAPNEVRLGDDDPFSTDTGNPFQA